MVAISSALIGFLAIDCKAVERIILVVAGLLMIQPGAVTDIIGLVLFAVILAGQLKRRQTVMA
jgi:TRAP-type uncharacterized transport system fused permease subunit